MSRKLIPAEVPREQIAEMPFDNVQVGDFSIMVCYGLPCSVYLSEQTIGEQPKQRFTMPRSTFNKLIHWYMTGHVPDEDPKKRKRGSPRKDGGE